MNLKHLLKIFIIFFLILSTFVLIKFIILHLNEKNSFNELIKTIIVEGMETNPLTINTSKAFCEMNNGFGLETSCNKLTKENCNLTSCCVWTSEQKCKAGNHNGPLFGFDLKGKTIPLDFFLFQNVCYGEKCNK